MADLGGSHKFIVSTKRRPDLTIEKTTFERLQRHAQPLVDTVDAVVNRALDALETDAWTQPDEGSLAVVRAVDPDRLPDLTHTKVLAARLGPEDIEKPNWNRLLHRVLVPSKGQVAGLDELRRVCPANMVRGTKTDEGYHHVREIGISVQGLSANEACAALTATGLGGWGSRLTSRSCGARRKGRRARARGAGCRYPERRKGGEGRAVRNRRGHHDGGRGDETVHGDGLQGRSSGLSTAGARVRGPGARLAGLGVQGGSGMGTACATPRGRSPRSPWTARGRNPGRYGRNV